MRKANCLVIRESPRSNSPRQTIEKRSNTFDNTGHMAIEEDDEPLGTGITMVFLQQAVNYYPNEEAAETPHQDGEPEH